ncbi:hypothetical protein AAH446_00245 [Erwinia sp. P6884]|uniref:hypothetical protein n=1 Tax=Erwinia sp. P6884 TaxID=3141450 RepID=UPI0031940FF9
MTIYYQENNQQVMIGEATLNLIFSHQDITLLSLIEQLHTMADDEQDDDRLLGIWQARKWLQTFSKGWHSDSRPDWLEALTSQADRRVATIGLADPASGRPLR